jgi:LacI family transcriptional regulator
VVPTLDNAIFSKGLEHFQTAMANAGFQLIVASCNYDPNVEETQIRNLLLRGVEAVALWGASQTASATRVLRDRNIPYIHLGTLTPPRRGYACGFDNFIAIQMGVQHLLDLGHRHFCMLTGITRHNDRAMGRLVGARTLLKQKGLALSNQQVREVPYNISAARSAFESLMRLNPKTTALICGQDVLAYGALLQGERLGLQIPKDLSIIGFDDLEFSQHLDPALTTIRYDAASMWGRAAESLLARINGGSVDRLIPASTTLVVRKSSAKPRRSTHLGPWKT